jgi:hypothetical protein
MSILSRTVHSSTPFQLRAVRIALHVGESEVQFRFKDDLIAHDTGNFIGHYFFLRKAGGRDKEKSICDRSVFYS